MDIDPLDDVGSWKEVVQPTKKPRSVDPRKLKLIQTAKKTTSNKKTRLKNKKSRSVMNIIQIPEDCRNKNKKSRSHTTPGPKKPKRRLIT